MTDDYDPIADAWGSVHEAYRVIRERAAKGGPWWIPKAPHEMNKLAEIIEPERIRYAGAINDAWDCVRDNVLRTGELLVEAKANLPHGSYEAMVQSDLKFDPSTGRRLVIVYKSERLRAYTHVLPTSWFTLYALTTLSEEEFQAGLEHKIIRPAMVQSDVSAIKNLLREQQAESSRTAVEDGCTVEDLYDLIRAGKKYAAIYADPPWSFEVYSGKGKQRSADRHYDTMSLDDIKALPIEQLAADDCALFLWAVMPELPGALDVIRAWGFEYKTVAFNWVKTNENDKFIDLEGNGLHWGMGYWTRANTEICLLATRGSPKRQAMDVHQVIVSPVSEHSRKPDAASVRIERLLGGPNVELPYLELFGRRPMRGWTVWGNQISRGLFHQDIPEFAA